MSYIDTVEKIVDEHIEKYQRVLDMCENDCEDLLLNSAIIEELNELKNDLGLV